MSSQCEKLQTRLDSVLAAFLVGNSGNGDDEVG
jgi:hypothetical protein